VYDIQNSSSLNTICRNEIPDVPPESGALHSLKAVSKAYISEDLQSILDTMDKSQQSRYRASEGGALNADVMAGPMNQLNVLSLLNPRPAEEEEKLQAYLQSYPANTYRRDSVASDSTSQSRYDYSSRPSTPTADWKMSLKYYKREYTDEKVQYAVASDATGPSQYGYPYRPFPSSASTRRTGPKQCNEKYTDEKVPYPIKSETTSHSQYGYSSRPSTSSAAHESTSPKQCIKTGQVQYSIASQATIQLQLECPSSSSTPATARRKSGLKQCNKKYTDEQVQYMVFLCEDLNMQWEKAMECFNIQFGFAFESSKSVSGLQCRYYRAQRFPFFCIEGKPIYDEDGMLIMRQLKKRCRGRVEVALVDDQRKPIFDDKGRIVIRQLRQDEEDTPRGHALRKQITEYFKLLDRSPEVLPKYRWAEVNQEHRMEARKKGASND
jgi:hypothetical protein